MPQSVSLCAVLTVFTVFHHPRRYPSASSGSGLFDLIHNYFCHQRHALSSYCTCCLCNRPIHTAVLLQVTRAYCYCNGCRHCVQYSRYTLNWAIHASLTVYLDCAVCAAGMARTVNVVRNVSVVCTVVLSGFVPNCVPFSWSSPSAPSSFLTICFLCHMRCPCHLCYIFQLHCSKHLFSFSRLHRRFHWGAQCSKCTQLSAWCWWQPHLP